MTKPDTNAFVRLDLNNPVFQENMLTLQKPERYAALDTLNKALIALHVGRRVTALIGAGVGKAIKPDAEFLEVGSELRGGLDHPPGFLPAQHTR